MIQDNLYVTAYAKDVRQNRLPGKCRQTRPSNLNVSKKAGRIVLCLFALLSLSALAQPIQAQPTFLKNLLGSGETSAPVAQPDVSVLLFTQDACPPCAQIRPMIDHLIGQGFPIQKVDVAATPGIAHQWRVSQTPTLVVIADGKEVQRQSGIVTAHQVGKMLIDAGYDADLTVLTKPTSPTPLRTIMDRIRPGRRGHREKKQDPTASIPTEEWTRHEASALASSVRIKVNYQEAGSVITDYGTGTVIHRIGNDILILTCGHVFRDSQGQARIELDLGFDGGDSKRTVAGQLVMFDAGAPDVAIISATTDFPVQPVAIADINYAPTSGSQVFTVGCDQGAPATVRRGQYLSTSMCGQPIARGEVDRDPPARKYDVTGRPVVGRSGGGLFSEDGKLIGVCNAAVIEENQGVYSAIVNVHQLLAKNNLAQLFQPGAEEMISRLLTGPAVDQSLAVPASFEAPADDAILESRSNRFVPDMAEIRREEFLAEQRAKGDGIMRLPNQAGNPATMRAQSHR